MKYIDAVLSGKVVAGELVKLACRRFLAFMDNPDYEFRPEKVQRIIDFYGDLRHYTGRHAGKPFILEDWQTLPLAALGFYRKEDNTRLIRQLYIEMARKQGKTAWASSLCLYGLIADGEWNAEVDLAANNLKQAKICFEMCQTFCKTLDPKKKYLQPYRDKIKYPSRLSNLLVFPADASGLDGFNAHFWCLHPDSMVTMSDGGRKKIKEINVGDKVLSYDIEKDLFVNTEVVWCGKTKKNATLVRYKDLICTPDHLIFDPKEKAYKKAQEITSVLLEDGSICDEVKFERVDEVSDVYDITLSEVHNFYADGVLVHNCLDEFHAAKDQRLLDVLVSSQGMRENGLGVIITTAGFDKLGPCYNFRTNCVEVLHGTKQDDTLFPLIYCLDEGDDWKDENVWIKSNPNLGVTVRKAYLREQVQKAINNPSDEVGVKTKNLNIWCDAETVWIPDHYVLEATEKVDLSKFKGMDCYVGVDLSAVSDLTAVSFMFPTEDKIYFYNKYYLPEAALFEKRFSEMYGQWRRSGDLTVTPGNVVDYDYILNDILTIGKDVFIQKVAYDTWNATQFTINATEAGLMMEPWSQTLGNFNRPTREFERLMLSGKIVLDNNIINRHCLRNVVLSYDRNGNVKPTKAYEGEGKRIDGTVAMLESLGVFLMSPRYGNFY